METNSSVKQRPNSRGRWSVRLNNDLLDLVQKFSFSWSEIALRLGFDEEVFFVLVDSIVGVHSTV